MFEEMYDLICINCGRSIGIKRDDGKVHQSSNYNAGREWGREKHSNPTPSGPVKGGVRFQQDRS